MLPIVERANTIEDVRIFWESNALWSGESRYAPGSKEFFEEHRQVVVDDCMAGRIDPRTMPPTGQQRKVLDLGCGPGFWTVELARFGCGELCAVDLTESALELAKRRCAIYGIGASFQRENAESLTFPNGYFSHVNCQGVIHHTPNTAACVSEIARVLERGGTASISVYYRNAILRRWWTLRGVGLVLAALGGRFTGRGREGIFRVKNVDEIVRLYDGAANPIGKSYSRQELVDILSPYFDVRETFLHFSQREHCRSRSQPLFIAGWTVVLDS